MRSKTSLFSKQLLKQDLLSTGWIGIVYFAGLIFALPFNILMRESDNQFDYSYEFENLLDSNGEIQLFLHYIIPVALGVFLFRYMQVKNASDFIHSLPLKRGRLFNQHFIAGVFMLIVPLIITAVLLAVMQPVLDLQAVYSQKDIWQWFAASAVFTLLLFSSSVFIAMFTGISAVQGVLTYIFLLFPAGILVLIYSNLNFLLYGFPGNFLNGSKIAQYSPLTDFLEYYNFEFSGWKIGCYIVITLLLYGLALFIYQKRPVEASTQPMVFRQARPIFKYGVTACMMLFGGYYFGETERQYEWIIFGYLLGSLLGYLIAEMVLQKNWRVFGKWKGYAAFILTAVAVFVLLSIDITGYERRVPDSENIESVYFSEDQSYINEENAAELIRKQAIHEQETIENIRKLHEHFVEEPSNILSSKRTGEQRVFISYQLSNGSMVNREYYLDPAKNYETYLKPIYESDEYKEIKNRILTMDAGVVDELGIYNDATRQKTAAVVDPVKVANAIKLLKQDIYDQSYQEMVSPLDTMAYIVVSVGENTTYHLPILRSYERFGQWLKENDLYDKSVIQAEDVSHALILDNRIERTDPYRILMEQQNSDNGLVIEDNQQLQEALESTVADRYQYRINNNGYIVGFYFDNDDYPVIRSFSKDHVPAFVKDYFENQ
ncbi:DUF6449 domain-containing protein [Sediminibacillus albus]|uniref:ABC-2 type transport system permease protein n=1 Tax=Sediminibacillus albus TaxID=407036 RepID=A0A1G8WW76_9BACI|nr:DUF6449 domain-containing protein [Sediminibacillus albus]SDJ82337.1 ABC-2 type transport system permease protein [Sediminibacillus albus]